MVIATRLRAGFGVLIQLHPDGVRTISGRARDDVPHERARRCDGVPDGYSDDRAGMSRSEPVRISTDSYPAPAAGPPPARDPRRPDADGLSTWTWRWGVAWQAVLVAHRGWPLSRGDQQRWDCWQRKDEPIESLSTPIN